MRGCWNGVSSLTAFQRKTAYKLSFLDGDVPKWKNEDKKEQREDEEALAGTSLREDASVEGQTGECRLISYHDSVFPGEDCELIQSCHEIPTGGGVACNKDAESQDGERVHEARFAGVAFPISADD